MNEAISDCLQSNMLEWQGGILEVCEVHLIASGISKFRLGMKPAKAGHFLLPGLRSPSGPTIPLPEHTQAWDFSALAGNARYGSSGMWKFGSPPSCR